MTNLPTDAPPSHNGAFSTGVMLGLIIGSGLALWYAPQSGAETRATLQTVAKGIRHRFRDESIEEALEEGRHLAHQHRASQAHTPSA